MSIRLPCFHSVVHDLELRDTPSPVSLVSLASNTFVPNTMGLLDALNLHELLWKHQIIPSDISAKSVLLAEDPDVLGATGFLSDIEAAHMPQDAEFFKPEYSSSAMKDEGNLPPISIMEAPNKRRMAFLRQGCAAVVGNSQFMAIELLQAAITSQTIQHTAEHDIELFTWVLGYCMLRKLCNKVYAIQKEGTEHKFMKESFWTAFGEYESEDILWSRQMAKPFAWCNNRASGFMEPFFQEHVLLVLQLLLQDIISS
ncbi:hypothetical protein EWM64_g7158 [Hericium alpestre]|uniref:Fungal-type protein kinase domain-containing protein n=1 Tax=Hericium alpestre TaxID=135208 RepID=A0A4Y9ZRG6_9AGAM|nr:hypothetical protein EWM64_g7158 [Hericium alpestre]